MKLTYYKGGRSFSSQSVHENDILFSSIEEVSQVQRLLPKLRTAPNKVIASALLLVDYFRPLPYDGYKYGAGLNPKGRYPFIALTDNGSFNDFRAGMPYEFKKVIEASSFGRGKYVFEDTNVTDSFDDNDFVISYNWLTLDDKNITEAAKALYEFIKEHDQYKKYIDKDSIPLSKEDRKKIDDYLLTLMDKEDVNIPYLLSKESSIKFYEFRDKVRKEFDDKIGTDPISILTYKIKSKMKLCKIWVDKYRGFTDVSLKVALV